MAASKLCFTKVSLFSFIHQGFQRQNTCMLKTIFGFLPRSRFCSVGSGDADTVELSDAQGSQGKKLDLVVSCLRLDRVAASAFGIGRSKFCNLIASGDVFVNKRMAKKGAQLVKEGDEVDLSKEKNSNEVLLSRFNLTTIDKDLTKKDKRRISVTRNKSVVVSRKEFDEKYTSARGD